MFKSYRRFIFIFCALLVLYVVLELNKPKQTDWTVTLSKDDENPYGAYVLFNELKQLFPNSSIGSFREPPYNILSDTDQTNTAYLFLEPSMDIGKADLSRLLHYAEKGNYIFAATYDAQRILDTLGLKIASAFDISSKDSASLNFVNPLLKTAKNYTFKKLTIDEYFSEIKRKDSTIILGANQKKEPDFVKVNYGKGAFFIHAAPLCFSNYFMLFQNNNEYISKTFSYLPATVEKIYWDEFYKQGRDEPQTPLRFLLSNEYLLWALRITLILLIVFVLFDMKRRQRIIPVTEPLRNTSLDFIKTVSSVYFHQHDNKSIAEKKMQYWFDNIRSRYYLSTQNFDEEFIKQLSKKSGASAGLISKIISYSSSLQNKYLSDADLLELSKSIDTFYQISQQ